MPMAQPEQISLMHSHLPVILYAMRVTSIAFEKSKKSRIELNRERGNLSVEHLEESLEASAQVDSIFINIGAFEKDRLTRAFL